MSTTAFFHACATGCRCDELFRRWEVLTCPGDLCDGCCPDDVMCECHDCFECGATACEEHS